MVDHARQLSRGAEQMGIALSEHQAEQLLAYMALLNKWNKAYNLTAVRDPNEMVSRHLLDSLSVLPHVEQGRWLDVGSTDRKSTRLNSSHVRISYAVFCLKKKKKKKYKQTKKQKKKKQQYRDRRN